MRRPTHRLNATSSIRNMTVRSNLFACRSRWNRWVCTLSTFEFYYRGSERFEQTFRILLNDRQNHVPQLPVIYGLGESSMLHCFLEPDSRFPKRRIVPLMVVVTVPDSQQFLLVYADAAHLNLAGLQQYGSHAVDA